MRTFAAVAAVSAALLTPALALAQDAPAPAPAAPPPSAAIADEAPTAPPPRTPCELGEHAGIDEPSAETARQIVCDALLHAGASPADRYRVTLGRLGSVVVLGVEREGSGGATVDSRRLRLSGIEEVTSAAPRLADSIVRGTPMAETEKVDNLVGEETRQPRSRGGITHFAMGLVGVAPPLDQGLTPAPGLDLDVHYETASQHFELGGSMRFGGGSGGSQTDVLSGFFLFSLGGRLYLSDTDFSPYVGAGVAWSYLNLSLPSAGFSGDGSGLGGYVDAGIEVLRTHHAHLAVGARLDLPFYDLHLKDGCPSGVCNGALPQSSLYYAPLSLEVRLTF